MLTYYYMNEMWSVYVASNKVVEYDGVKLCFAMFRTVIYICTYSSKSLVFTLLNWTLIWISNHYRVNLQNMKARVIKNWQVQLKLIPVKQCKKYWSLSWARYTKGRNRRRVSLVAHHGLSKTACKLWWGGNNSCLGKFHL